MLLRARREVTVADLDLPRDAAGLVSLADKSRSRSLNELVELTTRQVRACSGASAALWQGSELTLSAASHPDISDLTEVQLRSKRGPELTALESGQTVRCPDTLGEERWPEYAQAALYRGVRCSVTLAHRDGVTGVTLSMFGARPRAFDSGEFPVAELLVAVGGTVVGTMSQLGDVRATTEQFREAAEARALVDQAKGILMEALGCSAEEAFSRMRSISQQHNLKVTEVARRVIESRSAAIG